MEYFLRVFILKYGIFLCLVVNKKSKHHCIFLSVQLVSDKTIKKISVPVNFYLLSLQESLDEFSQLFRGSV